MRKRIRLLIPVVFAVVCLLPSVSAAQLYAADRDGSCIYSYSDTTGTVAGPDTLSTPQADGQSVTSKVAYIR
ncbi:hypothetical protein KAW64_10830 [bacterium]|nr:hypothetical protein [bacterium]